MWHLEALDSIWIILIGTVLLILFIVFFAIVISLPICIVFVMFHFVFISFYQHFTMSKIRIAFFSVLSWFFVFINAYRHHAQNPHDDFAIMIPFFWITGIAVLLACVLFAWLNEKIAAKVHQLDIQKKKMVWRFTYYFVFIVVVCEVYLYFTQGFTIIPRILFYSFEWS